MIQPPIGIDLGTTNSLIAYFEDGQPHLVPDSSGEVLTPSVVYIDDGEALVGQAAKERLATDPSSTTAIFKRKMGTKSVEHIGGLCCTNRGLNGLPLSPDGLILRAL